MFHHINKCILQRTDHQQIPGDFAPEIQRVIELIVEIDQICRPIHGIFMMHGFCRLLPFQSFLFVKFQNLF